MCVEKLLDIFWAVCIPGWSTLFFLGLCSAVLPQALTSKQLIKPLQHHQICTLICLLRKRAEVSLHLTCASYVAGKTCANDLNDDTTAAEACLHRLSHVNSKQPQMNVRSGQPCLAFGAQGAAVTVGGGKAADTAKGLAATGEEEEGALGHGKGQDRAKGHSKISGPPLDGMQNWLTASIALAVVVHIWYNGKLD